MNLLWEERFKRWAGPLSATEDEKCENAERAIREAMRADSALAAMDIRVFAQGSYKANTNVRLDSDVDVCICNRSVYFTEYPQGSSDADFGNSTAPLTFAEYKDLIQNALYRRFTLLGVKRGDKAFEVHANSYRVNADAVPTFEYRWYTGRHKPDGSPFYISGVKFITDRGISIINWPDHTYVNGVRRTTIPAADIRPSSASSKPFATRCRKRVSQPLTTSPHSLSSRWLGMYPTIITAPFRSTKT